MHSGRPIRDTSWHAERAIAGRERSIDWIVARISPLLLVQAETRLGPALRTWVEPEDLVEDVWMIALPRLGEVAPTPEGHHARVLVKYLSTVLLHRVQDLVKQRLRHPQDGARVSRPDEHAQSESSGVVTRVLRSERRDAVRAALHELDEADLRVIVLRAIEQRPQKEVATLMSTEPGTVAVRLHRALGRLRTKLPESIFDELSTP